MSVNPAEESFNTLKIFVVLMCFLPLRVGSIFYHGHCVNIAKAYILTQEVNFMPSANVLEQKKQIVAELIETLKSAQAGVLVDYRGITVEEDTRLRSKLREAGVEYKVVKNTLTRFAANEVGFGELILSSTVPQLSLSALPMLLLLQKLFLILPKK